MGIKRLEEHDYDKLESYWFRYQEMAAIEEQDPNRKRNLDNITSAVETLYNDSSGIMREFIEDGYFGSTAETMVPKHIAEQLGITQYRLSNMRKCLMKDMANLIGYV